MFSAGKLENIIILFIINACMHLLIKGEQPLAFMDIAVYAVDKSILIIYSDS